MARSDAATRIATACKEVENSFPIPGYLGTPWKITMAHTAGAVLRHLPAKVSRARLMDIGCGPMDKTAVFQKLGFECWAMDDLSDPWVGRTGAEEAIMGFAEQIGIRFSLGDFQKQCEVPRNYFDVVTIFDVIEHLHESPRTLLNLAGELLRPNGLLLITMPNSVNLRKRIDVLRGRTNYPDCQQFFYAQGEWRGHVREYTLSEARWICEAAGWEVIASSTFENLAWARLPRPLVPLFLLGAQFFPGARSGIAVLASKPYQWRPREGNPEKYRHSLRRSVPAGVA